MTGEETVEIAPSDLARTIIALRIADTLTARALVPREQQSNHPWEDLDPDECAELDMLLGWSDAGAGDKTSRLMQFAVALGDDTGQRDDLVGLLTIRLCQRLSEEGYGEEAR
jgi:hypothetical protein